MLNQGGYKAAVRLLRGPQVDLMVMPPGDAGTYRIHFTGSKEHNVRLRERARDQGWSLSEKGFQRIGEDGEPLTGPDAELRTFATEAEAYGFLGLPFIEPELREDAGEIEAALSGTLPTLIALGDLRGDLHSHSDWSDGTHSIEVMAEAAQNIQTAEITTAVRSAQLGPVRVREGDYIGIVNGNLAIAGQDMEHVINETLKRMRIEHLEIITLYFGEGVSAQDADELARRIKGHYSQLDVQVVDGGQAHYAYIISAE